MLFQTDNLKEENRTMEKSGDTEPEVHEHKHKQEVELTDHNPTNEVTFHVGPNGPPISKQQSHECAENENAENIQRSKSNPLQTTVNVHTAGQMCIRDRLNIMNKC